MAFYIQFFLNLKLVYDFMLDSASNYIQILLNGEIIVNAESILRDNNINAGYFTYTLYIISNTPTILLLIIKKISNNKLLLSLLYSELILQLIVLLELNIQSTTINDYFVLLGTKYCNIINNIKLYSLKNILFIKTLHINSVLIPITVSIFKLLYSEYTSSIELSYSREVDEVEYITIGEPNFYEINLNNGVPIVYKNLSNLYDNTTSILSNQLIQSYLTLTPRYIDYTTISNFVYYGGAVNRLDAFVNKLSTVYQEFNNISFSIDKLYSAGYYQKIMTMYRTKLNLVVTSFDEYLKYLFNTYPKTFTNTSSITSFLLIIELPSGLNVNFVNWYAPIYTRSNLFLYYSGSNRLYNTIPMFIRNDQSNYEYVKFIDMVGSFFDNIKLDIDRISAINSKKLSLLFGVNNNILSSILSNYDILLIKTYNYLYLLKLYLQFLGVLNNSPHDNTFTFLQYNKLLWSRFISNIYFLLKSKGTRLCIYNILNIFGINKNIINVKEFTGYNNDSYIENTHTILNTKLILTDITTDTTLIGTDSILLLDFYYVPEALSNSLQTILKINDYLDLKLDTNNIQLETSTDKYSLYITSSGHYNITITSQSVNSYYIDSIAVYTIYTNSSLILNTKELELCIYSTSVNSEFKFNSIRAIDLDAASSLYQYIKYYNYLDEDSVYVHYDFTSPRNFESGIINNRIINEFSNLLTYVSSNKIYLYIQDGMTYYSPLFNLAQCDEPICQIQTISTSSITLSFQSVTLSSVSSLNSFQNNKIFIGMDSAQLSDQETLQFFGSYGIENLINENNLRNLNEYLKLRQYRDYYYSHIRTNTYDINTQIGVLEYFDNSIFKTIKSFLPSKCDSHMGILVRNPILFRNKVLNYSSILMQLEHMSQTINTQYLTFNASINNLLSIDIIMNDALYLQSELSELLNTIIQYIDYLQCIYGDSNLSLTSIDDYTYYLNKNKYFTDKAYTIPLYYEGYSLIIELISENILYDMYNYRDILLSHGLQKIDGITHITSSILRKIFVDTLKKLTITTT